MKILVANCSQSELGWEIMSWQGYVRKRSLDYEHVIVCTQRGREYLYQDFTSSFVSHAIGGVHSNWGFTKVYDQSGWAHYQAYVARLIEQLRQDGNDVIVDKHDRYIPIVEQSFAKYGTKKSEHQCDVVIHARDKPSKNSLLLHNWPQSLCDDVCGKLNNHGLKVTAVGSKNAALLPAGAKDMRGVSLDVLSDIFASCGIAIGPSSGPLHLASLCGTPHLVWSRLARNGLFRGNNKDRYERVWNPFNTPCRVLLSGKLPTVESVVSTTLGGLR